MRKQATTNKSLLSSTIARVTDQQRNAGMQFFEFYGVPFLSEPLARIVRYRKHIRGTNASTNTLPHTGDR
jgi:hypothetical protein